MTLPVEESILLLENRNQKPWKKKTKQINPFLKGSNFPQITFMKNKCHFKIMLVWSISSQSRTKSNIQLELPVISYLIQTRHFLGGGEEIPAQEIMKIYHDRNNQKT